MVLSSINAGLHHSVLTFCNAALPPISSVRLKWRSFGGIPNFATVLFLVIIVRVGDSGVSATAIGPPSLMDLPRRIFYFMDDGLILNCSVLSVASYSKSSNIDSATGVGVGKRMKSQVLINWYKVLEDGSKQLLNHQNSENYEFRENGRQLEIKPLASGSQHQEQLKKIKGSYFCEATNQFGQTRSRKCFVTPVSLSLSANTINIKTGEESSYRGGTAVLNCELLPHFAYGFYRLLRWEITDQNGKTTRLINSTDKYSVVKDIYPFELHVRRFNVDDRNSLYKCVLKSEIRLKSERKVVKYSDDMTIKMSDAPMMATPFLHLAHRHATMTARKGTSVELPCVFSSATKLKYIWYHDHMQIYPLVGPKQMEWKSKYQIVVPGHSNLRITNLGQEDSGDYFCKAENVGMSGRIKLNVSAPLGVRVTPQAQTVDYSKQAIFNCSVDGYPLDRIYWLHNGKRVKPSSNRILKNENKVLIIKKVDRNSVGVYQCLAESGSAKEPQDNAQASSILSVTKMPPQLVTQFPEAEADGRGRSFLGMGPPSDKSYSQDRKPKSKLTIRCDFVGNPTPRITWFRDDERIPVTGDIISINSGNTFKELLIDMGRAYEKFRGDVNEVLNYGGEYKAVAKNEYGTAECKTFVEIDAKMTIRKFAKIKPIEGRTLRLKCYVLGRGTFKDLTITWVKKDNNAEHSLPNNHRHNIEENGRSLVIKRVKKEEDDGRYTCTAANNAVRVSEHVDIDVKRLPVINSFVKEHHLNENQDKVTVTCNIKNQADEPWYAWWEFKPFNKNVSAKVLKDSSSKTGVRITYPRSRMGARVELSGVPEFVPKNTWVMLGIDRPEKAKHSGNYTCIIKNKVGQSSETAHITFKPKIIFKDKPDANPEVTLNETLELPCSAKGNSPKPTVEWKYFNHEKNSYVSIRNLSKLTRGRISQTATGTLIVRNISRSDPTQFMCFVSLNVADAEAISQVVKVNVHYPASIRKMTDKELKVGDKFNLTCHVEGDGDIDVDWLYFDNRDNEFKLMETHCFRTQDDPSPSNAIPCKQTTGLSGQPFGAVFKKTEKAKDDRGIIHLIVFNSPVVASYQTKFRCRAKNKYNKKYAQQTVKLTVISKPGAPEDLKMESKHPTNITLKWKIPTHNGNKPISKYMVRVLLSPTDKVIQELNISAIPGKTQYHQVIKNLHPAYEYKALVSAVNAVGKSTDPAYVVDRTLEDKPSGPVRNITANGTSSDTISISWFPPAADKQNGHLLRHKICLAQAGSSSTDIEKIPTSKSFWDSHDQKCHNVRVGQGVTASKKSSTHFRNLPKFTKYFIRIEAVNNKGKSPPAFSQARTLEDVPQQPPIDVVCQADASSVKLEWNPPNQDDMNGILTGYTIQYFETNEFEDESTSKVVNISSNTRAEVEHLREFTNYTFRIYAVNSKGSGPPSKDRRCQTKPSNPDMPAEVKAFPFNETCLAVTWRHPNNSRGILTQYTIRVIKSEYFGSEPRIVHVPANTSVRYNYEIVCHLARSTYYIISVQAMNHAPLKSNFTKQLKAKTTIDVPARILAFNDTIVTTNNVDLDLSCQSVGSQKNVQWRYQSGHVTGEATEMLRVKSIEPSQSGIYECEVENVFGKDHLIYNVHVRVVKATPPNPPKLSRGRVKLTSLEVEFRPTGSAQSRRRDTPILRYWLTYINGFTKEKHVTEVNAANRTYFLSSLTCGTTVTFAIKAENKIGNSSDSNTVKMRTRGQKPIPSDTNKLLGPHHQQNAQTYAYLNLKEVFKPGDHCDPLKYRLFVWTRENKEVPKKPVIVHFDDLVDKCCYNYTKLNAGSFYNYKIEASNAAGAENISGTFYTYTKHGKQPIQYKTHESTKLPIWRQPAILIGLIFIFVICIVVVLALVLLWRRRVTAEQLREHEKGPVTQCVNDLKGDIGKQAEPGLHQRFVSPPLSAMPPSSRIRAQRHPVDDVEEESDDGSMDSDGNINPYATFATYESNTIDRLEMPDAGPRELGAVERESDMMRERLTRMQPHSSQKRKRPQYYEPTGPRTQYENESVPGTLAPIGGPSGKRRANSLEDLESVATYNRGYATGGGGQMGRSFYESKYTDQLTAPYRGSSVISSTTMSSNHDELTQAYEYGRRARYESSLNTTDAFTVDENADLHTGSGSSETTDPGIRQFTQQPPMPDEQRQATCEVPLFKTAQSDPRRTSINQSDTYEAVDEAYYKGRLRPPQQHPPRQWPLPDVPPMATTLGRQRVTAGGRPIPPGPAYGRHRTDSDSGYSGPNHIYDSTDSYYSSYTPGNIGRRMPGPGAGGMDFPRSQRQMPSGRYYNGSGPGDRHGMLAAAGAKAAAARPLVYGPNPDPEESRALLMNRRLSARTSSGRGGSSTGGSGSSSSAATVTGPRRPSRPNVPVGAVGGAVAGAAAGPLMGPGPRGDDSDSEAENIYTSEFTVV